jgi:uncharacterized protein YecE (DUF72 family)
MVPIYIGTAGWSIPKQHAAGLPQAGTHLERYSRIFSCAEINSSFYRSHRASTWEKWAASVPENFRFSVKAPKAITHVANLACTSDRLSAFLAEARILSNKLGPILFQLPPKSAFNPIVAESFFSLLRDKYPGPTVFEPRNPTWFTAEADHLLHRFHIARAAADPARVPAAGSAGGDHQLLYCRLHGSPRMYYSTYPDPYLRSLAAAFAQHSAKEIWCIFDNTASGAALDNALMLQRLLRSPGLMSS